jgi:hypothetical protein
VSHELEVDGLEGMGRNVPNGLSYGDFNDAADGCKRKRLSIRAERDLCVCVCVWLCASINQLHSRLSIQTGGAALPADVT